MQSIGKGSIIKVLVEHWGHLYFLGKVFLGSMLPQYMALSNMYVCYVCVSKKNLGHFEAWYEVELWYADCSHKFKINKGVMVGGR